MGTHFVLFSLCLLSYMCSGDEGVPGDVVEKDDQDMLQEIFGRQYSGYESKHPLQMLKTGNLEEIKDCSAFTASAGLRCVSYHNCDEGGKITKSYDNLINVRFDESDADDYVSSLYCPGKFEICCQDPDFVTIEDVFKEDEKIVHEAIFKEEEKPVYEAIFTETTVHLLHENIEDEENVAKVPECPQNWINFQTSCYYFGTSPSYLTWAKAQCACKDLNENSTLPSVHSEAEDQFLQSNTTSHPFWLGASRAVGASYLSPSSWSWSDGSAMNYTAWASGQPNNYWWGERCVRSLEREVAGEQSWDDHKCWSRTALALICKLDFEW